MQQDERGRGKRGRVCSHLEGGLPLHAPEQRQQQLSSPCLARSASAALLDWLMLL